jgi:type IV secretory pathway VirB6-like protein
MLNLFKSATALLAGGVLVFGLAACEKREQAAGGEGPAERAGQHIDQAAAKAGQELNKLADKAGQGMQQAGEKLQNKAQEAQQQEPQKQ